MTVKIRRTARVYLLVLCVLLALLFAKGAVLTARAASIPGASNNGSPQVTPQPQTTEEPEEPDDEDDDDDDEEDSDDEPVTIIERRTIREILFPYENLSEGVQGALGDVIAKTANEANNQLIPVVNEIEDIVLNNQDSLFAKIRGDVWRVTIVIAGILMPLTLVVSVGSALKEGAVSVTGYASAREALINWAIGVGAAASSFFLLSKAIELSINMQYAIRDGLASSIQENWNLGEQLIGGLINTGAILLVPKIAQIFLGFFAIFMAVGLVASIALALLAREVILLLAVGVAPIVLIGGTVRPLRWLSGLWTKVTTITLLLGPANFLLLGIAILVGAKANTAGLLEGHFIGFMIALGVLSVLIGLNTLIGKMVYGAAIEVAQKAWKSTMAVINLAAMAAGFAVAPAIGGMIGGSTAAGSTIAGTGVAMGTSAQATGIASAGAVGKAANIYGQATSQAQLTSSIGRAIASTNLPGARGFGAGLSTGGAANSYKQLTEGIRAGITGGLPRVEGSFNAHEAVEAAQRELIERFAPGEKVSLGKGRFTSLKQAEGRIGEAGQVVKNSFAAMDDLGINRGMALAELGYYQHGGNLKSAAESFARTNTGAYALRGQSDYVMPKMGSYPPAERISGHDVQGAMDIIINQGVVGETGGAPASPTLIAQLSRTIYHRRSQMRQSIPETVQSARYFNTQSELAQWMRSSYYSLPHRDRAADLAESLGIKKEL